ncbi:SMI1/KNR4 family protein [Sporosarcina sp. FSL W7-1349]|uniref:SMI1/KNR4 family protein n=1 Tax=Sporosarcina sp. FSL W7-1349 TaxID=2921561 RepID=UPI0030F6FA4B
MWKSYIRSIANGYHFTEPADHASIARVHQELHVFLPPDLLTLLNETDGVFDEFNCPLIWPADKIVEENLFFRNFADYKDLYMPFDHLLFFSDSGAGDLFGYSILNGQIQRDDIFVWNHEDDSRTWVASSLKDFIDGWVNDRITV